MHSHGRDKISNLIKTSTISRLSTNHNYDNSLLSSKHHFIVHWIIPKNYSIFYCGMKIGKMNWFESITVSDMKCSSIIKRYKLFSITILLEIHYKTRNLLITNVSWYTITKYQLMTSHSTNYPTQENGFCTNYYNLTLGRILTSTIRSQKSYE